MARILAVDDEIDVLIAVRSVLEDDGHTVVEASSGPEALMLLSQSRFDMVVLDVIMPEMSGIQVCRQIRSAPSICKILILFLTAEGRPNDIVEGLDAGADDYLVKPFAVVELPARVRALLRRVSDGVLNPATNRLTLGGIVLDVNSLEIHVDNRMVSLTPIEHRLLHALMMQAGQPISTDVLLESVWDYPPRRR